MYVLFSVVYIQRFLYYSFLTEAVHRYYESRRRLFNDNQPSRLEKAKESKKNSKKQSLRKQVFVYHFVCCTVSDLFVSLIHVFLSFFLLSYDQRKKHVKQKGKEKWAMLNY